MRRAFILVIDSLGIGSSADAGRFGDAGADTLGHIVATQGGLGLPNLAIEIDDGDIVVEDGWTFPQPWADVLAICRKVQDAGHPLLLYLTAEHYAEVLTTLDPRGLACNVSELATA